jgi:hypothetical protein
MTKFKMTNLFGSLVIGIWDFLGMWCLGFDISEHLNTRDSISFHIMALVIRIPALP